LLQNMRDGKTQVVDVPVPQVHPAAALVRVSASLVSAGTERMLVEFAEKSLLGKAQARPDLARQVIDKARREGILTSLESAFNRLDQPMALGYSCAGTIEAVGEGLKDFKVGDRVACAGSHAVHAEYVVVSQNLLAHIPDSVGFEEAAFSTLGAIAMEGFRLAQPQVGDNVAIIGLGLLGLLTTKIALAAGCQVFGVDVNAGRVALGATAGATTAPRSEAEAAGMAFTHNRGFDAVIICADTPSDDTVVLAGQLARDHGHVISTGVVGLNLPRKLYFEKELFFQVSRSSGAGRYDDLYEEKGIDYPYGLVRWTEGRNLQAFVDFMGSGKMDVLPLISHRFKIDDAAQAYELITGKGGEPFLGVLLTYPAEEAAGKVTLVPNPAAFRQPMAGQPGLGVLGAGNYASASFLPNIARVGGVNRMGIVSAAGASARHAAQKYGFAYASSSAEDLLKDSKVDIIAVLTRHNQHARHVVDALQHGKHVFCEKPLAINEEQLEQVAEALKTENAPLLTVGFNRRFAPFVVQMHQFLSTRSEPLVAHYRVNAGYLPLNHWIQDPAVGGGRIIGEGCHFVDTLSYLVGALPISVTAQALLDQGRYNQDNVVITLTYPDGSLATIDYLANGDKSFPKEYLDVFCGGKVAVLDDYRRLELTANGSRRSFVNRWQQDKGHRAILEAFITAVRTGGQPPIPYADIFGVTHTTFAIMESLHTGMPVKLQG
ncbi:MAG TPA: bi-domain-containing oxidoreductase, partial [Longilinea sp.]|nr:bi-domain-containing oxidoreductase [Longilinea sp.]